VSGDTAPVTEVCNWCGEPLLDDEVRAPNMNGLHYACGLRMTLGSVGHQSRQCSCFGGDEEDPLGMTMRQAAEAAMNYFHRTEVPRWRH
jgi:hypothetical protein